jgi:hypothetical protein
VEGAAMPAPGKYLGHDGACPSRKTNQREIATRRDSIIEKLNERSSDAPSPQRLDMIPASLVIAADRGTLKAYQVNETPTRGPSLKLIQAFDITDAHGRLVDKVTDLAGRFPVTESAGAHRGAASISESKLETETDRRINKELAEQIAKIVNDSGKEGWAFAAPSEIHGAIVDLLPDRVRNRIVEHVKSDLVKVEPAKLPNHFRSLRPV